MFACFDVKLNFWFQSHPDLFLTYLGSRFGDEETAVKNREEGFPACQSLYLAVCNKLDSQHLKAQRFVYPYN